MRVLLDTQVVYIAAGLGGTELPKNVREVMQDPGTESCLSSASVMEIAIKNVLSEAHTRQAVLDLRVTIIPFEPRHAYRLFSLPPHHRDPFDRMLIATALAEDVPLASGDRVFRRYKGLQVLWR
ncbi:MAG: type II toxin-antitoxin system VapC family toxin [Acidobacteriaceae bacterium]|nr:type II toxin-antitoxin system VapC family toxin [Acidobacteriaceae bacterium]